MELTYVEITAKNGKHIVFRSVYRAPNTSEGKFREHIDKICKKASLEKDKKELVLGMDHNLDLLKGHEHQRTQAFLDQILDLGMIPTITHPTRITNTTAT